MERYYGLVIEWKDQPPTLMECELSKSDAESVMTRMERLVNDPRVIRVAMVSLEFARGHDGLVPQGKSSEAQF